MHRQAESAYHGSMVTADSMVGLALTCYHERESKFRSIVDSLRYRFSPAPTAEAFLRQVVNGRTVAEVLLARHQSENHPDD